MFDLALDGCTEEDFPPLTEEELTALALSDDPDRELSADAVPLRLYPGVSRLDLPLSYMPPVTARAAKGWRVPVVFTIVISLLLIEAFGLCITYGILVAA